MKITSFFGIFSIVVCIMLIVKYCHGRIIHPECRPIKGRSKRDLGCPTNLLPINYYDTIVCDCQYSAIYFPDSNSCNALYRQGPCPEQHYVYMGLNSTEPSCVKNPCKEDGLVLLNDTCYKLNQIGPCPFRHRVNVDMDSFQIKCVHWNDENAIFPLYDKFRHCPRGSVRDRCGLCRKPVKD